jgi:alkaline phosphatase/alkaline phosphatase D
LKLQAIRQGPWKLHLANGELYNLVDDIGESKNVAGAHPDVVASLRAAAEQTKDDLGMDGVGAGCRPLGKAANPQPLINHEGTIREGFSQQQPKAGQGIMLGEVTATRALAQVRLTKTNHLVNKDVPGTAGVVRFTLFSDGKKLATQQQAARADADFIARAAFNELKPDTEYTVQTEIGEEAEHWHPGPQATFRTLPGGDLARPVRFVVVTGMNYAKFHGDDRIDRKQHLEENNTELPQAYAGPDKHLGYPGVETIRQLRPNFFVGTGDNVYYDTPDKPRAETLPQLRQKWHEQFVQPRYRDMFAIVPTFWMIDDHDYRIDDGDNSGDYNPTPQVGRDMMLEQLPVAPGEAKDAKTYRTHRESRDLQVWCPENRMYRSPNADPDGPKKTIWGAEQKAWLKRTLAESDATFKLLISPTPMIGPDDLRKTDNHTDVGGFQHERDEFFVWLKSTGIADQNFYLVCGDRHWQYHSIDPTGIEEFSCGALVDANSRPGRLPGDPLSTDPKGTIKQPYSQKTPSGGFLLIESLPKTDTQPARLTFRFHDEHGEILHENQKTSR